MCDICTDLAALLESHDQRLKEGGLHLAKDEVLAVVLYVQVWQQRQCMCCYKEYKNFERFNNIVQAMLNVAISFIQTLPQHCQQQQDDANDRKKDDSSSPPEQPKVKSDGDTRKTDDANSDGATSLDVDAKEKAADSEREESVNDEEMWTLEEKDRLFQFVTKVFLMNFPMYMAYKHSVNMSLEELSQQEAAALNNYCELSDSEIPVYLLRNVCFYCDSNGIQAIARCFDQADPEILPYTVAHTLINIIANLRLWMNIATVMQNIVPLRSYVIRYMCRLSDRDLRLAGTRNMTDLMWAAVKEPIETQVSFDKEGLDLAFKYFTCSTLTIRLAGITQINNQISLYNELANNESLMLEADGSGSQLANWLIENKIIDHIFGPNLHVEIIKQSQFILNFLAMEGRITADHLDVIWAAAQLKYCGRQVLDILIALIKNLDVQSTQHLLRLVSQLDPAALNEQMLYLASALIKFLWNTAYSRIAVVQVNQPFPVGLADSLHVGTGDVKEADFSSSEHSDSAEEGSSMETEEGEIKLSPAPPHCYYQCEMARSPEGATKMKIKVRSKRECDHAGHHELDEDDSSLCAANSDLSNISEGSLPSDLSPDRCSKGKMKHKRRHIRHLLPHGRRLMSHDRCLVHHDGSESESENADELHAHMCTQRHHHGRIDEASDEEEEDEDEEEEEEEMEECETDEEVNMHMRVVGEVDESKDDLSEYSAEECDNVMKPGKAGREEESGEKGSKLAQCRKPKGGLVPHGDELSSTPKRRGRHDCCSHRHHVKGSPAQLNMSTGNQSVDVIKHLPCTSGDSLNSSKEAALHEEMDVAMVTTSSDECCQLMANEKAYLHYNQKHELDSYLQHVHTQRHRRSLGDYPHDVPSPGNSSHLSTKSDKNMADFEGEDVLSEEELAHINAHAHFVAAAVLVRDTGHHTMQHHLANMASSYDIPLEKGVIHAHRTMKVDTDEEALGNLMRLDDVCKPSNTLLWDLLQDDTAHLLPEGLIVEAEKVLCSLVCFSTDRCIRTQFIEACIENLANNRSVVISLRLLPKLFGSFQQYRTGLDTHRVTMWAEKELRMMQHFFENLSFYTTAVKTGVEFTQALYSYKEEIQVRLQFLTWVFSMIGSPEGFCLSLEQVDTLWNSLATDPECSDDCFNWFLNQAKSKDHHAMGLETFKHIFVEKMPQLKPEAMTIIGMSLFTQLCSLARVVNASLDKPLTEEQVFGVDQLWGIALRARDTNVYLRAIHYLNNHYINYGSGALEKEEEFVQRCMDSLVNASSELEETDDAESTLQVIQRGFLLLTNHLESFRKRYAFHLRIWQLDGVGISSHQKSQQDKQSVSIRVILQPGGTSEKTTVEMNSTDLVAELRAEVTRWWQSVQKEQQRRQQLQQQQVAVAAAADAASGGGQRSSILTPILGAMLGDGPIRMITLGQELTVDMDEKTLAEMQFKELQLVFVSLGASRQLRKHDGSTPASYLPQPDRNKIPMMLLLGEPHFGQLFSLLQQLSSFQPAKKSADLQEEYGLKSKATVLSRNVWDILMLLPTNPLIATQFHDLKSDETEEAIKWDNLLDRYNAHKLMYSLQVAESLSRPLRRRRRSVLSSRPISVSTQMSIDSDVSPDEQEQPEQIWSKRFIAKQGLKHLFSVFLCGSLQTKDGDHWNEWQQECLAYLLRLVSQFAVIQSDMEMGQDDVFDAQESPRKKMKKVKASEKTVIPRLNQAMLSMIKVDAVVKILMTILYDAAMPSVHYKQWPTTSWGRVEVVHYAFSFLVSWAYSCEDVQPALCNSDKFAAWLKRLTLQAPEPPVRQEACQGLYKLCLGRASDGETGYSFLLPILASLLVSFQDAQSLKPAKRCQEEKEPYGPGCRDYFWLLCRLVENITPDDATNSWEQEGSLVDLNALASLLADCICNRDYIERRDSPEDDGLIGLITLLTAVVKHNPPFKSSPDGCTFMVKMFWCLFALPSPKQRHYPKCKSQMSRSATYDLLVEMVKNSLTNYKVLHELVLKQHNKDSHASYTWDNWPHEEERSKCGYVGLTNLGATCYMATCMQHLYMIPQARRSVLEAKCAKGNKNEGTLLELQKMFAYLLESERKAYNPRSFCKVYTMNHQPLNTGEQKDMTEFFQDLISKLEDMGIELKTLVKSLFGGVITNNVVSLDCPHVSRNKEEFYTVRCQVADLKNLFIFETFDNDLLVVSAKLLLMSEESLDEVTVKDMLEGDNMYTCSKCQKKVRAEKRACFKRLPKILCFNTMRYTFNMVTMTKEKINTHFSFPLRLDMAPYMEKNLIRKDRLQDDGEMSDSGSEVEEETNYELIGVTVHTGTADGGHYYSFIRDQLSQNELGQDKWYLFNDAEVKTFDTCQIAAECFGGVMTSKTYDSVTEKFMDFSFEKTNSAYMLFYERMSPERQSGCDMDQTAGSGDEQKAVVERKDECSEPCKFNVELSKELADWIWEDNMHFLQDKNIFEHTYFGFMWQMCGYIPTTLKKNNPEETVSLMAAQLSTSFVLETLIHAKEKPTMLQWIELLTKQFNSCHSACEWFLNTMAEDDWWPQQILIKCPNQMVRQMFQRLLIHVINQLKTTHSKWYLYPLSESEDLDDEVIDVAAMGNKSCVTRFIKKMLAIIDHGSKPHCKYLMEYFAFLHEFAKMGSNESQFLLRINAISVMVAFFMSHKAQENYVEIVSDDDDDDDDDIMLTDEKYRPQSLEKMIALIAMLVDKSRGVDKQLHVSQKDYHSIVGGKGFPFLYNQIRDCINIRQTCNLIFSLCRWNERLAVVIVQMIFGAISRLGAESQPFFKLLSMLVEFIGGPPGMPSFTRYVLQKFWEAADYCPQQCLEWLALQVTKNKFAHAWTLQNVDAWVEPFLLAHNNVRVRNSAAYLLIALVPSSTFRQAFRTTRSILSPHKDLVPMGADAVSVLHEIYSHLLRLLSRARQYVDASTHGTTKLVPYFAVMNYCLLSRTEKQMFSAFFLDLWQLFQPKLSEPPVSMHHNKQALLVFWHQVCVDCPDNVKLIVSNAHVTKNIAFNYILADHEDQDVVLFNRAMLPAYYGILRMCCQQSRTFTRQLAQHQNMQWAFKNITPYPAQYTAAVDELFKMMRLMIARYPDMSNEEWKAIAHFKRSNIQLYLQNLDARTSWQTLITALKILVENTDDKLLVLQQRGLPMLHEAFSTLHVMHHEATACHVTGDIIDLLSLMMQVLKVAHQYVSAKKCAEVKPHLSAWKERVEFAQKLLTLLNSFTPPEVRQHTFDVLREMVLTFQNECLQTIVPVLVQAHRTFQDNNLPSSMGPYFPKRGQSVIPHKTNIRPSRPQFQMFLHSNQLEASKGVDEAYDQALSDFFFQYHHFVDLLVRVAVNQQSVSKQVVNLSAMVAYEGVPLHAPYFAKLWYEIYQSEQVDKDCVTMLCNCSSFIDYVDAVLLDERQSLNNQHIYQFFCNYFPKVYQQVLNEQCQSLMESLVSSIAADRSAMENVTSNGDVNKLMYRVNGDLRALLLIFSVQQPQQLPPLLLDSLHYIQHFCRPFQQERAARGRSREPSQEATEGAATPEKTEGADDDTVELPAKRRKTISGNSADDTTTTDKLNSPVTDSKSTHDQDVPTAPSDGDKPTSDDTPRETTPSSSPKRTKDEESSPRASTSQDSRGESPQPSTSRDFPTSPCKKWRERSPSPFSGCLTEDVIKSAAEESKTQPADGSDSGSDVDTVSTTATKSSDVSRRERSVPKQKPTMLDMVIKNTELIFNMLKKRV